MWFEEREKPVSLPGRRMPCSERNHSICLSCSDMEKLFPASFTHAEFASLGKKCLINVMSSWEVASELGACRWNSVTICTRDVVHRARNFKWNRNQSFTLPECRTSSTQNVWNDRVRRAHGSVVRHFASFKETELFWTLRPNADKFHCGLRTGPFFLNFLFLCRVSAFFRAWSLQKCSYFFSIPWKSTQSRPSDDSARDSCRSLQPAKGKDLQPSALIRNVHCDLKWFCFAANPAI